MNVGGHCSSSALAFQWRSPTSSSVSAPACLAHHNRYLPGNAEAQVRVSKQGPLKVAWWNHLKGDRKGDRVLSKVCVCVKSQKIKIKIKHANHQRKNGKNDRKLQTKKWFWQLHMAPNFRTIPTFTVPTVPTITILSKRCDLPKMYPSHEPFRTIYFTYQISWEELRKGLGSLPNPKDCLWKTPKSNGTRTCSGGDLLVAWKKSPIPNVSTSQNVGKFKYPIYTIHYATATITWKIVVGYGITDRSKAHVCHHVGHDPDHLKWQEESRKTFGSKQMTLTTG